MAGVDPNAVETYDNSVIREDLAEQYTMISPEEVPFQTSSGQDSASQTLHEWPIVNLAAVDPDNRVIEGEDAPDTDVGTLALRLNNYTQISDKKITVTNTSEAVDAAAENVQRESKQIALKLRELKRDLETMLLSDAVAISGSSGVARSSAGLHSFIRTNTSAGATGTDPTLSGTTEGYPDVAAGAGTLRALTEEIFNDMIEAAWIEGGNPNIAMVNSNNKRIISENFTGSSTRYKDAIDKTLVNAIDVYDSDFGQFSIVPNRFQPTYGAGNYAIFILDPDLCAVSYLETTRQRPLAMTGHSKNRLAWNEYTLTIFNEAGLAIIRDLDATFA